MSDIYIENTIPSEKMAEVLFFSLDATEVLNLFTEMTHYSYEPIRGEDVDSEVQDFEEEIIGYAENMNPVHLHLVDQKKTNTLTKLKELGFLYPNILQDINAHFSKVFTTLDKNNLDELTSPEAYRMIEVAEMTILALLRADILHESRHLHIKDLYFATKPPEVNRQRIYEWYSLHSIDDIIDTKIYNHHKNFRNHGFKNEIDWAKAIRLKEEPYFPPEIKIENNSMKRNNKKAILYVMAKNHKLPQKERTRILKRLDLKQITSYSYILKDE